jgi:hypothetical protein
MDFTELFLRALEEHPKEMIAITDELLRETIMQVQARPHPLNIFKVSLITSAVFEALWIGWHYNPRLYMHPNHPPYIPKNWDMHAMQPLPKGQGRKRHA